MAGRTGESDPTPYKNPPPRVKGQKGRKMELEWNIPNENLILDKLDELRQAIDNFPQSRLVPVWQHAIEQLEVQLPCRQN